MEVLHLPSQSAASTLTVVVVPGNPGISVRVRTQLSQISHPFGLQHYLSKPTKESLAALAQSACRLFRNGSGPKKAVPCRSLMLMVLAETAERSRQASRSKGRVVAIALQHDAGAFGTTINSKADTLPALKHKA